LINVPKSKPDKVVVHRIELQQTERDLLEMMVYGSALSNGISTLMPLLTTLTDPARLYGFLTLLEMAGLMDTPVPTVADLDEAVDALKNWRQNDINQAGRAEETKEFHENAAVAVANREKEIHKQKTEAAEAYRDGEGSWETVTILQKEENRLQAEKWRQLQIAKGWKYWFYFMNSGMEFDDEGRQVPGTGRWPTKWEVFKAKASGEYY
jgi:hypothetical protein